ncbi:LOW QUALITY PROTEIN: butyrophilin subfamily 1 member A1 [Mesocricetus auratus]|uniref:LOW QUALITY PROTEIN: butyrophilin subfamily 1 member A1 n=1 Tax=Mesocricetus auratus TaxID=10036 RepID=A0ABM2WBF6_MESAU|nr:LOW QUALITY PROTEIN: butyrophilin subfamily 1 member A1 [Mesocricetus auratus]
MKSHSLSNFGAKRSSSEDMGICCQHALLFQFTCLLVLEELFAPVSTKEFAVFGPSHPVVAELGGEAVLPCSVSPAVSLESMEELRWYRTRFSEAVFVYRNQQEQEGEQLAEFSGRTSLVKDQFVEGRAAVRIHKVWTPDSGAYICLFKQGVFYAEAILELKVAVMGSVPEVYIKGSEDGGVCVVCRASGWYPKPQVQWRDSRGETLPASPETHSEGAEGLFTVETSMVVRNSSLGNVTCSASNPTLGQEKAMAIVIPEPFFPQTSPWVPAFAITMTVTGLLVLGSGCLLIREQCSRRQLRQERERLQSEKETKEDVLKTICILDRELDRRKAAYMAAWRKAQLYADWRKEHFQAWPVTLDPDSAHPILAISQDRMQVTLTDNTMCLDDHFSVLGMEGISSGRCYWKVKIKNGDCSKWILGVCRGDVERKGLYFESPEKGFWTVGRSSSGYWAYIDTGRTLLSFRKTPQCVGVFVDYSEGDISFYNMSDLSHIFSFHKASFSGTLLPYFRIKSGSVWMSLCSIAQACDGEEGGEEQEEREELGEGEEWEEVDFVSFEAVSESPRGDAHPRLHWY